MHDAAVVQDTAKNWKDEDSWDGPGSTVQLRPPSSVVTKTAVPERLEAPAAQLLASTQARLVAVRVPSGRLAWVQVAPPSWVTSIVFAGEESPPLGVPICCI
jgi:hypothetical protein